MSIVNAFSVDVEDYFHVEALAQAVNPGDWGRFEYRAERNTRRLLELLAAARVRATFFMLGWIAERSPALVRDIHAAGHEVACHGENHQVIYRQSRDQFERETRDAKARLEQAIGAPVAGYRAATYSIRRDSLWALEVLESLGFRYDSSIFPIHHDLYGIPGAPRFPYRPGKGPLLEVPITTVEVLGQRLPCGGGGYFRLLPYRLFRAGLRRVNARDRQPGVFYCHPWEIDPGQPRVAGLSWRSRFRHYTNLARMEARLQQLLADFRWDRMDRVFGVGVA
ncbi:MAG TPA: XrtA system polysaccharide deacetylase [Steroidobacteraceae bacterium]|jgi:polysaccharide deacetylase family protein (PEP-CTERM system associated)